MVEAHVKSPRPLAEVGQSFSIFWAHSIGAVNIAFAPVTLLPVLLLDLFAMAVQHPV